MISRRNFFALASGLLVPYVPERVYSFAKPRGIEWIPIEIAPIGPLFANDYFFRSPDFRQYIVRPRVSP